MRKEIIEKRGYFKVVNRKEVYRNPWLKVIEDQVINTENETEATFGTFYARSAVATLPFDEEGFVYLNREYKYAHNKTGLYTAGGFLEDEDPIVGAKRELREETGFEASELIPAGELSFYASVTDAKYYLFFAKGLKKGERRLDLNEKIEVLKLKFEDAYQMVINNEISYAPAVALILKAKELKIIDENS